MELVVISNTVHAYNIIIIYFDNIAVIVKKCMCVCVYEWCVYMYVVSVCQVCMFAPT